jgi:hypothetical protein
MAMIDSLEKCLSGADKILKDSKKLKLSYDIGFVYRRMDRHGETSIPPYNFVAGGIKILGIGFLLATHIWEQICLRTPDRHFSKESMNLLKFYQLFTGEERRIPFFFDDFHFCRREEDPFHF